MNPDNRYTSFMLRFQWMKNDQQPTWIVSIQRTGTGELRWFPNLDALITFLREEFGACEGEKGAAGESLEEQDHEVSRTEKNQSCPGNRLKDITSGRGLAKEE